MLSIREDIGPYNARRYGKPWIARVNFALSRQGTFEWGEFVGDATGGALHVQAMPGDIVAIGQRDNRGRPEKSAPVYHQVQADGTLVDLGTSKQSALDAVEAWRSTPQADEIRYPADGKYAGCADWRAVIEAARSRPQLSSIVETWEATRHPACLNAIMDNADLALWVTFRTGRVQGGTQ